jgi:hypothetical protein
VGPPILQETEGDNMSRAIIIVMEDNEYGLPFETIECADRAAAEKLVKDHDGYFTQPLDGGYRNYVIVSDDFTATYDETTFRSERGAEPVA